MRSIRNRLSLRGLAIPIFVLALLCCIYVWQPRTHAQDAAQPHQPVHMTTDWSNRHMVYSAPSSVGQALQIQAEPRYLHQWARRNLGSTPSQPAR